MKKLSAILCVVILAGVSFAAAETCAASSEMDPATRSSIEGAARQVFQQMQQGDVFGIRQNSVAALSTNFDSVQQSIVSLRSKIATDTATIRNSYLLDATGNAPLPRATFLCGVYGQADFTSFVLTNLPPGRYALAIIDANGASPQTVSLILQQSGNTWKLAGYYPRPENVNGHDGQWLLQQARDFRAKGENHNAWFYYLMAWDRIRPVNFMTTKSLDQIGAEISQVKPSDVPTDKPIALALEGMNYTINSMFVVPQDGKLHLVVKRGVAALDPNDKIKTDNENKAFVQAFLKRYPEYKEGFDTIVARAVPPQGEDFGTQISLKESK